MVPDPDTTSACQAARQETFLVAPMGRLFLKQALPMIVVTTLGGVQGLVDAAFLGRAVGPEALAAVSLVFPASMLAVALSSLVGGGMASHHARALGAGRPADAARTMAGAHGLALALGVALASGAALGAGPILSGLTPSGLAEMARLYVTITLGAAPVQILLAVQADGFRSEGRAGAMALLSVGVTLVNVVLNAVLILGLDLGVAGSAWGTVLAQSAGLALLLGMRARPGAIVPLHATWGRAMAGGWGRIVALGAPSALGFVGVALVSAVVIATLRSQESAGYARAVAAYGIVTRVIGLAFLPQMALALATQTIAGNTIGGGAMPRAMAALRIGALSAFAYGVAVQATAWLGGRAIGAAFVDDPAVATQVAQILRTMTGLWSLTGPVLVTGLWFQASGWPGRTAALTLTKPYLLMPVLLPALAATGGAGAIWWAFPLADGAMAALALGLVMALRRPRGAVA